MLRRVVITGMGAVTSSGVGVSPLWENVREGRHAFSEIKAFEPGELPVRYAAEIGDWDPVLHGIGKKDARRMARFTQFAVTAAREAVRDAGGFSEGLDPFKVGVIVASGIGGFHTIEEEHVKYLEKGPGRVSVFFIPAMISNMAGGQIAIEYGFKGDNFCPVSACASSAHAVGEAFRKIKFGYLDACLAGGAEASVTEFAMAGFNNMGALATGDDPARFSIPFDKERSGFAMAEGAGILVLEELGSARRRGAKIYAEVTGYGSTDDGYHITGPDPEGKGGARAMEFAMEEAGVSPGQVDYINAHGTATEQNDLVETLAIKKALGDAAFTVAVSSTKGVTGHLLGAAGAVEAIITAKALHEGILPPTAGYRIPDPACDLDYIPEGPRKMSAGCALSNSLGFGGHNVTIALARAL
ncbi:MAG: beta-ketoacyl-ACP synthase II [Oscillospiraceae bacterium]|nr:beta-ketoacyl-ACP synthase II [Oscillospiraceae bacterium]